MMKQQQKEKNLDNNLGKNLKENMKIPYGVIVFAVIMLLWNIAFLSPAFLAWQKNTEMATALHYAFSFTCHQIDQRSLCFFPDSQNIITSCTQPQQNFIVTKSMIIEHPLHGIGYKFAVCSRDVAIYSAMLLGVFVWIFYKRKQLLDERWPHPIWLLFAMIPIGIDGLTQLVGLRESTNELRVITGAIVGFACAFYLVPVFNQIFNSIFNENTKETEN